MLYVEDNLLNLKLVEHLIGRRPDLRLLSARDESLGIQLARANQPDVILMDLNLPGMSGIEALKILRQDPATAHTLQCLPSAPMQCQAISRRVCEAGFFRYVTKPIKVLEFYADVGRGTGIRSTNAGRAVSYESEPSLVFSEYIGAHSPAVWRSHRR